MWYVLLSVVSSKTAVPSQHLRRVLVGVLDVRETKAVHRLASDSCPSWSGVRPVFCRGCPFSARNVCRCRRRCVRPPLSAPSCRCQRCCRRGLSVLLCQALWHLAVVAEGLPLGSTLWCFSRFRLKYVKVPSSVTSLSCRRER